MKDKIYIRLMAGVLWLAHMKTLELLNKRETLVPVNYPPFPITNTNC
jgi:hypothetical protein